MYFPEHHDDGDWRLMHDRIQVINIIGLLEVYDIPSLLWYLLRQESSLLNYNVMYTTPSHANESD
jgi:hypothetical protein